MFKRIAAIFGFYVAMNLINTSRATFTNLVIDVFCLSNPHESFKRNITIKSLYILQRFEVSRAIVDMADE